MQPSIRFRISVAFLTGFLSGSVGFPVQSAPELGAVRRTEPAAGAVLVATRQLDGSGFARTVVLLLRHNRNGTLGVVLNRRTRFHLNELLPDVDAEQAKRHPVNIGGPVSPDLLLLVLRDRKKYPDAEPVQGSIGFSLEEGVLDLVLARRASPADVRIYAGHSGWRAGQLDGEIARGAWFVVNADLSIVFASDEDEIWERLIRRLDPPGIRI